MLRTIDASIGPDGVVVKADPSSRAGSSSSSASAGKPGRAAAGEGSAESGVEGSATGAEGEAGAQSEEEDILGGELGRYLLTEEEQEKR
jgi:hypothetical protein